MYDNPNFHGALENELEIILTDMDRLDEDYNECCRLLDIAEREKEDQTSSETWQSYQLNQYNLLKKEKDELKQSLSYLDEKEKAIVALTYYRRNDLFNLLDNLNEAAVVELTGIHLFVEHLKSNLKGLRKYMGKNKS